VQPDTPPPVGFIGEPVHDPERFPVEVVGREFGEVEVSGTLVVFQAPGVVREGIDAVQPPPG